MTPRARAAARFKGILSCAACQRLRACIFMSTRLVAGHRFNIAQARIGYAHDDATRAKIAASVRATKRHLRRQRLALRAATAAEAATADLRPALQLLKPGSIFQQPGFVPGGEHSDAGAYSGSESDSDEEGVLQEEEPPLLDMLQLEKAVMEMVSLRRQLSAWMEAQEKSERGWVPSQGLPLVYAQNICFACSVAAWEFQWLQLTRAPPPLFCAQSTGASPT